MATTKPLTDTLLTLTTTPTVRQLASWWEEMTTDKEGMQWFSDAFPQSLAAFRQTIADGEECCALFLVEDSIAGAYWLHDMVFHAPAYPPYAWVRGYVSPRYRGAFTATAWPQARAYFASLGILSLLAVAHAENWRARNCLTRNMGFTYVECYPNYTTFRGTSADCMVFSMRKEDVPLARYVAQKHASQLVARRRAGDV